MKIQLSKSQWEHIGKTAGWFSKQANGWGRLSGDLNDVIEGQTIIGIRKRLSEKQVFENIKKNQSIVKLLIDEDVSDEELLQCIKDSFKMYRLTAKREQIGLDKKAEHSESHQNIAKKQHVSKPCHPEDLITISEGLQCGNCLAVTKDHGLTWELPLKAKLCPGCEIEIDDIELNDPQYQIQVINGERWHPKCLKAEEHFRQRELEQDMDFDKEYQ